MNTQLTKTENGSVIIQDIITTKAPNELQKAMTSGFSSLSKYKRETSTENVIKLLVMCIREIANLCNKAGDRIINEKQAYILAGDILSNYYFLNPQEIRYAFMQGYKNQYKTKIFDTLELSHFTDWLAEYDAERVEYIVNNPDHKVKMQLPEPKERDEGLTEQPNFAAELIRKRQLFELQQEKERNMEFLTIADYCEHYNIDFKKLFAETNPQVDVAFNASTKAKLQFLDINGYPDSNRFKQHIAKVTLNAYNKYRPKTNEHCLSIALNIINQF